MGYFRLPLRTYRLLQKIAADDDRTVSYVVRQAVQEFIDRRRAA